MEGPRLERISVAGLSETVDLAGSSVYLVVVVVAMTVRLSFVSSSPGPIR